MSPSHDEIPAQDASPAHGGPLRSPGTLIEEADLAAAEAINGIPSFDLAGAVCDPVSPAPAPTSVLESTDDAGSHASPSPSQNLTALLSSINPPRTKARINGGMGKSYKRSIVATTAIPIIM